MGYFLSFGFFYFWRSRGVAPHGARRPGAQKIAPRRCAERHQVFENFEANASGFRRSQFEELASALKESRLEIFLTFVMLSSIKSAA
jgi:hypothetical protein